MCIIKVIHAKLIGSTFFCCLGRILFYELSLYLDALNIKFKKDGYMVAEGYGIKICYFCGGKDVCIEDD